MSSRQTEHSIHKRDFWTQFFKLYKNLPALWKLNHPLYKERSAKIEAYDCLIEKLREIEPEAKRSDVMRKINIFRTNYRRECLRIEKYLAMNKNYKTSLWYFHLLDFLRCQETKPKRNHKERSDEEKRILNNRRKSNEDQPRLKRKSNVPWKLLKDVHTTATNDEVDDDFKEMNSVAYDNTSEGSRVSFSESIQYDLTESTESSAQFSNHCPNNTESSYILTDEMNSKSTCIIGSQSEDFEFESDIETQNKSDFDQECDWSEEGTKQTDALTKQSIITPTQTAPMSEEAEVLSRAWAMQYDRLRSDQKIYACKAIADILFEGGLGNLNFDSSQAYVD